MSNISRILSSCALTGAAGARTAPDDYSGELKPCAWFHVHSRVLRTAGGGSDRGGWFNDTTRGDAMIGHGDNMLIHN